jgi:uncharacterized repeat protein (TIGR03803 family)
MKSIRTPRGCANFFGAIFLASLLCPVSPPAMAQDPSPALAQPGSREAWRESMVRTPLPNKGCFKVSYPSTEWQAVLCTTPPSYPLGRPHVGGLNPDTVGGGGTNDFAAQVSGLILTAEGSFISVTPGISETGNTYGSNCSVTAMNVANAFTLQLNTNTFASTKACSSGSTRSMCKGWQQFVFDNNATQAYIQYWLENYGTTGTACPAGWSPYSPSSNVIDCYTNNGNGMLIPSQTMADLSQITMTATAESGATDTLLLQTASGDLYASGLDSLLNLAHGWHAAEFNIFGDGCSSLASFSNGSTIVVKASVDDRSLDTPRCVAESFTGETDNLSLVSPCCPYGGASPNVQFVESNAPFATATCFGSGLQAYTTLASFNGTDGQYPSAALVQATNGDLYGTTNEGGASCIPGCGAIFKITPTGTLTALHGFDGFDGDGPQAALVQATNGNLYGTTVGGGPVYGAPDQTGYGTIFKITPSGSLTTLYTFCSQSGCPDGYGPEAGLIQATNGNLYGTTYGGGTAICGQSPGCGTIFKITPTGTLAALYSFCAQSGCPDGQHPTAGLIQAINGSLYGTTVNGGTHGNGTIFKITPTGELTTLHSFAESDGADPAGLIQATDGNLFGTTQGGTYNRGTVFKITPSGSLTTLYNFCSQSGCPDGQSPSGLIQATDGNLYGTTYRGGANGYGTVFKITPSGTLTTLYNFCSLSGCTDGAGPTAGLIQATDGGLYGTTTQAEFDGGQSNDGTVFSLYVGLGPFVETQPTSGEVGAAVKILGTNLTGATSVTFNGTPAVFEVVFSSEITTTVPAGTTTGAVQVVTPNGTLSSNVPFRVP